LQRNYSNDIDPQSHLLSVLNVVQIDGIARRSNSIGSTCCAFVVQLAATYNRSATNRSKWSIINPLASRRAACDMDPGRKLLDMRRNHYSVPNSRIFSQPSHKESLPVLCFAVFCPPDCHFVSTDLVVQNQKAAGSLRK